MDELERIEQHPAVANLRRDTINLPKDRYIELLEQQVQLLQKVSGGKPRAAAKPLSLAEKQRIIALHDDGLINSAIARSTGRSRSSVRNVIREAKAGAV